MTNLKMILPEDFYEMKLVTAIDSAGRLGYRLEPWPQPPTQEDIDLQTDLFNRLEAAIERKEQIFSQSN